MKSNICKIIGNTSNRNDKKFAYHGARHEKPNKIPYLRWSTSVQHFSRAWSANTNAVASGVDTKKKPFITLPRIQINWLLSHYINEFNS